jgi:hypothetical protein
MAQPAPEGARSPARTIAALANIPTPATSSEVAYLCASIQAVHEQLALVTDVHAEQLRKALSRPGAGLDAFKARRQARLATAPLRLSADRGRGAGAAALAAWRRFVRVYSEQIAPGRSRKNFQYTK